MVSDDVKIFLIDDDPTFLQAASLVLSGRGQIRCYDDPRLACNALHEAHVIISDFKMDFMDGQAILRLARERNVLAPIILITAHADKDFAIAAANLHAFAILEKPVSYEALTATVDKAVAEHHRRRLFEQHSTASLAIEPHTLTATVNGTTIKLTDIEYRILALLISNRGRRLSREAIHSQVWGNTKVAENAFDTHLGNLKKKLPMLKERLQVVRGKGYIYGE